MSSSNSSSSPLQNLLSHLHALYITHLYPHLPGPLQTISSQLVPIFQSGDIVSLAAFLVVLYFTIRIADYIRRSVFAWIVFLFKIAILLGIIQVALFIRAYGWERTLNIAGWWGGLVWGYIQEVLEGSDKEYGGQRHESGRYGQGWNVAGGRQQVPTWTRGGGARRRGGWT